jgi:hypothetical protein
MRLERGKHPARLAEAAGGVASCFFNDQVDLSAHHFVADAVERKFQAFDVEIP